MPRKIDPSSIQVGGGLTSPKSVEASSFVNPTQGLDGLNAHIDDPSRVHEAQAINIFDALGLYASDDVEGALQEIGSSVSNLGQSGVVSGGTYTPSGLLVTLGSTVVRNGTDRDITGESVTLTNNATCWLYVTPAGVLTHSTGGSAPSITSPENILLWRIVTSGGAITSSTDARFFVPNVDRKLSYTVRAEGTATDRNSEACFESLDAVLLYLEQFPTTAKKKKVVVRGQHTISTTVTISVDDVIFDGEDGAEFITGAALSPMFEVGGRSGVVFKNITFTCDDAVSTAITASTPCNKFLVQDCKFESGSSDWVTCVELSDVTAASDGIQVERCYFYSTGLAVNISRFLGLSITDCLFTSSAGSVALYLGDSATATATEGRATVSRCTIEGYDAAIAVEAHGVTVSDCSIRTVERGLDVTAGADFTLRDSTVVLGTAGTIGVAFSTPRCKIINCLIENGRSVWSGAENTFGVTLVGATDTVISGVTISSFLNTFDNSGNGIRIDAASARCRITDTYVDNTSIGVSSVAPKVNIQSFSATDVETGLQLSGSMTTITGINLDLSSTRGLVGVELVTGDNHCLTDVVITTSRLTNSYAADTPVGVQISSASRVSIKGLIVENLYSTTSSSYGIEASAVGATYLSVTGGSISDAGIGILTGGSRASLQGVLFESVGVAVQSSGTDAVVNGCSGALSTSYGTTALLMSGNSARVTSCNFTLARTLGWAGQAPVGCSVTGSGCLVSSSRFIGFYNNLDDLGTGITIGASSTDAQVSDVRINNTKTGILIAGSGSDIQVMGVNMEAVETGISVSSSKVRVSGCSILLDSVRGDRGIFVSGNLTDIVLSNCQVDCAQSGSYGIYVLASVQMTGLSILNCAVSGMTMTGILCLGQCRQVDIRGCSVDGYLTAAPYDPTADGIRVRFNVLAYPRDVSVQGCSVTRCTDGITVISINTLPVERVSVIGNRVTYCGWASTGPDRTTFALTGSKGIGLEHCQNIMVHSNTINKVGAQINTAGVEGFPTSGGPDVASMSIYLRNCSVVSVADNVLINSVSDGTAFSQGIVFDQLSSGAGSTFSSQGISINNNNIQWESGLPGNGDGHIGIQMYVDEGTDPNAHVMVDVSVTNNTINVSQIAGLSMFVGANATASKVSIIGNIFNDSNTNGVFVGLTDNTSLLTVLDISNNTVNQCGASSVQIDTAGGSILQNVRVCDNSFIVAVNEMILFDIGAGATCYDVNVDQNRFSSGSDYAVRIESGATAPSSYGRFKITNNIINGGDGFSVECAEYDLEEVEVTGNSLTGNATSLLNLSVTSTTDVTVSNIRVSGNILSTLDGGIVIVVDGTISDLDVSSNRVEQDSGAVSYTLDVTTVPGTVLAAQRYNEDWTIQNNLSVGGQGFRVTSSTGPSFKNLRLCDNIVRDADERAFDISLSTPVVGSLPIVNGLIVERNILEGQEGGSDLEAIYLLIGGITSVSGAMANGISVSYNTMSYWSSFSTQRTIWIQMNAIVSGLMIDSNMITNCGSGNTVTAGVGGFIDLELGQPGSSVASRGVSISRNTLSENNGGKGIYVHEMTSASASRLRGLTVRDNSIHGIEPDSTISHHGDGICVDLTGFTTDTSSVKPGDVHIDQNVIARVGNGSVVYSDAGVVFTGPSNLSVECCSIDGNSVSQTGSGSTGSILIDVNDADDLSVSRNKVVDSTATTAGIFIIVDGLGSSVVVESNSVHSSSGDGIRLAPTGVGAGSSGLLSTRIDGNSVVSSGGDGLHIEGGVGASNPQIQAVSLSCNRVHESTGCGINVYLDAGVVVNGMSVNTNEIYDSSDSGLKYICDGTGVSVSNLSISSNKISVAGSSGIEFGQDSSIASYRNIDVSNNIVSGVELHGIWLKSLTAPGIPSTSISGLSVCGNTVQDWSGIGTTDNYGGIKLDFLGASHVVVANNVLRNANGYSNGFWFLITGQIRSMVMTGNSSHLGDGTGTTSMSFDTGGSGDQASMTFTGNSFRAATTGVTAGGSFSPDQSILVGNTDRRTAAAGTLAAFGALFTNSQVANNQD